MDISDSAAMIVVTGANGRLGSQVVDEILSRIPADGVGVSVRDVDAAADLSRRGVRVRRGDFTAPETLAHAFEGAEAVLVVSAAIRGFEPAVRANCAAIDAARDAGVRRIVYTSHQAASPDSLFAPQHVHAATEAHLASAGVPYTSLRNGFYASTVPVYLGDALSNGAIVTPEDGPVSWTAHADLATAAAVALTRPDLLDGVTPPLTGPRAVSFGEIAAILSELTGREIAHRSSSDDAWLTAAAERGMPPAAAEFALGMFRAARRGEFDVVDPALPRVIDRPAAPVEDTLRALAHAT